MTIATHEILFFHHQMASSIGNLQFHSLAFPHQVSSKLVKLRTGFASSDKQLSLIQLSTHRKFQLRAVNSDEDQQHVKTENVVVAALNTKDPVAKFQEIVGSLPPVVFLFELCFGLSEVNSSKFMLRSVELYCCLSQMRRHGGNSIAIGLCLATAFLLIVVRVHMTRKSRSTPPGSVADLVRRGQLRSDRRGISSPLKYEDPFNNPLVKISKNNSTVEMCGKVYRLAPVTLTKEEQTIHQKRRSRAYQWKRPTMFLKEGDSVPPDVDPDTIRWIPSNHPFATIASDIDEDMAQNNVYQKHGVPFRIQAEHEALQRKLEALQSDQKLNKVVIDSSSAKEFERPFKLNQKSHEPVEQNPFKNQSGRSRPPKSDQAPNTFGSNSSSGEMQNP